MATIAAQDRFPSEVPGPRAEPEATVEASPELRRALVVLGMHRSGTSALTRVLSLCGASLPSHILRAEDGLPDDGNAQAGFWESKGILELHEEALDSAGSSWDDLYDVSSSWFESAAARVFERRLAETLASEFGDSPLLVAKDPRISRLLPIWDVALRELGMTGNWIVSVRNPLEVAASLERRDGFSVAKGLLLWLTYFLGAEKQTRSHPRMFVLYDDLLTDWRAVVARIEAHFGFRFSRHSRRAAAEVDAFVDRNLRHHSIAPAEFEARRDLSRWVKDAFAWAVQAAAGRPVDSAVLDDISRQLKQSEALYGPLLAASEVAIQQQRERVLELERQIAEQVEKAAEDTLAAMASAQGAARGLSASVPRTKVLAFLLPQYHPIPENDEWWGKGFTEWTNVTSARPWFEGHQQPMLPSELGFYDLRIAEVRAQQAALAREHGIYGFCYYAYWFNGRRLLERPLDEMLASGEPDYPFCICWANENWTRRWDGRDQEILIAQPHAPESDERFIEDILPALLDPRYIRRNGEPLLLVYRADLMADPLATTAAWREAARRAGLPGLHLCAVWQVEEPRAIGFDALVEFPPHHFGRHRLTDQLAAVDPDFCGEVFDYAVAVDAIEPLGATEFPVYRGVMPGWDNTPRVGARGWVFANSTPEKYAEWLEKVTRESDARPGDDDQFVFINAWNEWAEGAVLEPSRSFGRSYLEATSAALHSALEAPPGLRWQQRETQRRLCELADSVADLQGTTSLRDASLAGRQSRLDSSFAELETRVDASIVEQKAGLAELVAGEMKVRQAETTQLRATVDSSLSGQGEMLEWLQAMTRARFRGATAEGMWLDHRYGLLALALKLPLWILSGRVASRLRWWRLMRNLTRDGLFDSDDYRRRYPDIASQKIDPLYHYVRFGSSEGREPSPVLAALPSAVPSLPAAVVPEVVPEQAVPEQAVPAQPVPVPAEPAPEPVREPVQGAAPATPTVTWQIHAGHAGSRAAQSRAILVASHDAARSGAQLILLEIVKELAKRDDLEIFLLMLRGGEIAAEFESQVHTLQLDRFAANAGVDVPCALELVLENLAASAPMMALCNTVVSSDVAVGCARLQIPVLSLIHELPTSIDSTIGSGKLRAMVRSSRRLIAASAFVQDALATHYGLDRARLLPVHTGVFDWDHSPGFRQRCRAEVLAEFDLPEDAFLVLGCGTIHHRKGTDLFVQVAREVAAMDGVERMFFLWIGADQTGPQLRQWCEHDIQAAGLSGRVRLAGGRASTASYFGAADAFALTSREDPFPMVNLEAMARGVPVVAFADAGGAGEVLAQRAGILVPYLDVKAMAREIIALCEAPHYHAEIADAARRRIATHHRWRDYVDRLVSIFESDFGYRSR